MCLNTNLNLDRLGDIHPFFIEDKSSVANIHMCYFEHLGFHLLFISRIPHLVVSSIWYRRSRVVIGAWRPGMEVAGMPSHGTICMYELTDWWDEDKQTNPEGCAMANGWIIPCMCVVASFLGVRVIIFADPGCSTHCRYRESPFRPSLPSLPHSSPSFIILLALVHHFANQSITTPSLFTPEIWQVYPKC
jgi:hypothetical protein